MNRLHPLKSILLISSLIVLNLWEAQAQYLGIEITGSRKNVAEVPFQLANGYMVVKLITSNGYSLNCVVDTGSKSTIFLDPHFRYLLPGDFHTKKYKVYGADRKTLMMASLLKNTTFYTNNLKLHNQSVFILDETVGVLDNITGMYIDGILGMELFRRFIVKIDYVQSKLILYEPEYFKPDDRYSTFPITIENDKIHFNISLEDKKGVPSDYKMLLDSGAGIKCLLAHEAKDTVLFPKGLTKGRIGVGLGGTLDGYLGHYDKLSFGEEEIKDVLCHLYFMPDSLEYIDTSSTRQGLIGNKLMKKYHWIIDTYRGVAYVKPNRFYKKEDEDKSGLSILATGAYQKNIIVDFVIENSVADQAGLQKGDKIVKYGFLPVSFIGYEGLLRKLKSKEGKNIRLTVLRGTERLKFKFKLKKMRFDGTRHNIEMPVKEARIADVMFNK